MLNRSTCVQLVQFRYKNSHVKQLDPMPGFDWAQVPYEMLASHRSIPIPQW